MIIGQLRHNIRIEVPVITKDKFGAPVTTWNLYSSVWASIESLKGYDKAAAAANYPGADATIVIRYLAGVLPTMRIVYGNQIYSILGIPNNVDLRNRSIELTCQTGIKAS